MPFWEVKVPATVSVHIEAGSPLEALMRLKQQDSCVCVSGLDWGNLQMFCIGIAHLYMHDVKANDAFLDVSHEYEEGE